MANMSMTKVPVPEQDPQVRNHNFEEVCLGYTAEQAVEEAGRCLHCKNKPCVAGCPVNIRIPEFIEKVAAGDFAAAYEVISDTNALPGVSGRVCPQETQCEMHCVRGIKGEPVAIGRLERFVADWYREHVNEMPAKPESNGVKVAVVGSGPAGLTCASDLAKLGYQVTIFEAFHTAGGVLVYGIPEFRLPKAIVANEVGKLTAMGVDLETDMVVGKDLHHRRDVRRRVRGGVRGLRRGPAHVHGHPGGDSGGGVLGQRVPDPYQSDEGIPEQLRHPHQEDQAGRHRGRRQRGHGRRPVRQAHGGGARVRGVPPQRGGDARPAEEIHHAKEEGIEFLFLNNPTKILGTRRAACGAWSASGWSWASRTTAAAAVPWRCPAASLSWMWTR